MTDSTQLSIRQLADKLHVSHTAVRKAIAELQEQHGNPIGISQGRGKSTLLSVSEQELIAARFYVSANNDTTVIQDDKATATTELTTYESEQGLQVYSPRVLDLKVKSADQAIASAMNRLSSALEHFTGNSALIDAALVRYSVTQGKELGTKMALAKVGNAIESSETTEVALLKKLGIVDE